MTEAKLTPGQREALAVLADADEPMDTNAISRKAGHRYGPWAYGKLRALRGREFVCMAPPTKTALAVWEITDDGRAALRKGLS